MLSAVWPYLRYYHVAPVLLFQFMVYAVKNPKDAIMLAVFATCLLIVATEVAKEIPEEDYKHIRSAAYSLWTATYKAAVRIAGTLPESAYNLAQSLYPEQLQTNTDAQV